MATTVLPSTLASIAVFKPHDLLNKKRPSDEENWSLCRGCTQCCEYVCVEIDRPTRLKDVDHITWYLIHHNVHVWVDEENKWYVQFNTPCRMLEPEGRCGWYLQRPKICQDYKQSECPRYLDAPAEKFLFKNETDFLSWLARHRNKKMRQLHDRYLAKRAVRWQK
ncbi:MAG: YkgJ family cysteine cluster protein [bacterium]